MGTETLKDKVVFGLKAEKNSDDTPVIKTYYDEIQEDYIKVGQGDSSDIQFGCRTVDYSFEKEKAIYQEINKKFGGYRWNRIRNEFH